MGYILYTSLIVGGQVGYILYTSLIVGARLGGINELVP